MTTALIYGSDPGDVMIWDSNVAGFGQGYISFLIKHMRVAQIKRFKAELFSEYFVKLNP